MSKTYDVAVVGATGAVGETMLSILAERKFPVGQVYAVASSRSAGSRVSFGDRQLVVQDLAEFDFSKVQIGLFSPGASVSKEYAPKAAAAGCVVIDNTSQFRYDDDIPLVVPEVNPHAVAQHTNRGIIANPNCSTIQMLVALKPLHDAVGIERINVATYQAVSGTGKDAIEELAGQSARLLNGQPVECQVYPKQIAFNCLPHIDVFLENGYTKEEMKMVWETRKIFEDEAIQVNPTTVRVPVFYGHSEAVHIETRDKISAEKARELLAAAPGVEVLDERADGGYPTAVTEGANRDPVFVGRIREDISHPRGLNMWVVADNVRKGAALNSIQIAEVLIKDYL
ncbi:aspartate-semialdehyde dehydrogenase [Ectothiorhodospira haloalkaliphila]|uniref:Aspartate-semialdehyde dehydrogenase n=1 Tax=Ectothiorhodospira haloalkaliphila TaxID=421628 RepID=W8L4E3_9GAMM|nr:MULTISPECIES: aspartate-semialdehyde dehydrogenase [Ectothiorhodospira]AHK78785.1 aspartate-semialdehyde dehydrogenase [Ectothiorhodospira haloalkaliphila]MCG5495304.1 aspartate-semialdehyde dehydrogenase [Ectothiorhodospira variabilis]MCG5497455.1 aspartate-semialdehyde dehydrogenase [Ectothiorhodospira variabilis]MCG5504902.1 aspartate-semialdehyde dehydrogenase [Ectothiorhodospira variabilis]MCG5508059.1 aspartate-semialdehyde dehydrogenase [Ectothiorhodospira variabilis]